MTAVRPAFLMTCVVTLNSIDTTKKQNFILALKIASLLKKSKQVGGNHLSDDYLPTQAIKAQIYHLFFVVVETSMVMLKIGGIIAEI